MKKISAVIQNFNQYHFIILWTILNLLQIGLTELTSDEGYYWFYASHLEWGYYDHPPMLALLIKMGVALFSGELGVRLFDVLLMSAGLIFLFKILPWNNKEKKIIYIVLLSIPLFNYITFVAFPDTPLVAFSIISLYLYKRFLDKNDLLTSLLFGISLALMLYSKYHAVLFVFFILLSNLSLLKNKYFYLSVLLASILFIPHLMWQFQHHFPSFQYQISGRTGNFRIGYLFQYVTQQIPVVGIGIIFVPFIYKSANQFEKSLKYIAVGTFVFFLFSTFRGFVHLHWTSIMLFPVIILSAKYYGQKSNNKLFYSLTIPFLVVIFLARIYLAFDIFPGKGLHTDYYHGRKLWAEDIQAIAGKKPVVFATYYEGLREAPLYSFYTKQMAIALFANDEKKSQYQIWNYEDSIQSKSAILIVTDPSLNTKELHTRMGKTVHYTEVDNFVSFNNIELQYNFDEIIFKNDSIKIPVKILNHRNYLLQFTSKHRIYIVLTNSKGENIWIDKSLMNFSINARNSRFFNFSFCNANLPNGSYNFYLGLIDGITDATINSKRNKLTIAKK